MFAARIFEDPWFAGMSEILSNLASLVSFVHDQNITKKMCLLLFVAVRREHEFINFCVACSVTLSIKHK